MPRAPGAALPYRARAECVMRKLNNCARTVSLQGERSCGACVKLSGQPVDPGSNSSDTVTPPLRSRRAYARPSSRRGSSPAVISNNGGKPATRLPAAGAA